MCGALGTPAAALDADPTDGDKPEVITKTAMDAAIKAATADTVARMNAMHTAMAEVAPHVGTVAAMDSAESVYKLALDSAKIDTVGVHPSAYRAMVKMLRAKSDTIGATAPARVAMDAASKDGFKAMFPNASEMKGGF